MLNLENPNKDNSREEKRAIASFLNAVLEDNDTLSGAKKKSLELNDQKIISKNLEMMETSMNDLAMKESMGGNAGGETINGKHYSCVALNGYADRETGEIFIFGNSQDISPKIIRMGKHFTFREAMDINMNSLTSRSKIVSFLGREGLSQRARKNLETCIDTYNQKYWQE
jgi:hypothetical protein